MFNVEEIIGDIVFLSFVDKTRLTDVGIQVKAGHFLIRGHDHLGLWVEHPGLFLTHAEDEKGKPLPVANQSTEQIPANFLIPWDHINTIMHYPDREGYDFPSEFEKDIGFKFSNKEDE